MVSVSITTVGWLFLGIFQILISISFFHHFKKDRDKRKLMFGLAFFALSYSHFYETFIYLFFGQQIPAILENIQYWSFYPIIFAIGIAVHQNYLKTLNYNRIFTIFLIFSLICFPLIVFNPLPAKMYVGYLAIGFGIEILLVSLLNIRKHRDFFTFFMFLALVFVEVGGIALQFRDYTVSIFGFFIGGLFILLMFWIPKITHDTVNSDISDFFMIKEELAERTMELHDATERYKRLTDTMPEGILTINKWGKITYANPAAEKIFNISLDQSKGTNFTNYITKESMKISLDLLKRIKAGEDVEKIELEAVHKDTHIFPVEIWATPLRKNDSYDGLICVVRDITKQKEIEKNLRASEFRYRTVFEGTGTAMGIFGADSVITLVNAEFYKLTGYTKAEVEHTMHWYDFITDEYKTKMFEYHKKRTEKTGNPPTEYNCDIIDKTGCIKTVHVKIGLFPGESYRIVSLTDITDQKKAQKKLEEINTNLEKIIEGRTKDIQMLLKQKDEFIHQLGHDLKNPLGPLISLIPLLKRHETDQKYQQMLDVIERNTRYMKDLVSKTLELAQLNSPNTKLTLESISIKEQMDQLLKNNAFLFDKKHMIVKNNISNDVEVNADRLRLDEVFTNLLNNAVKYSNDNGIITINAEETDKEIQLSIQDTGIGMKDDEIRRLFVEFYKADPSRHDFDSSGLGLVIVKRIIEKHGGRIWAESPGPGKGSTFYFTLPKTDMI